MWVLPSLRRARRFRNIAPALSHEPNRSAYGVGRPTSTPRQRDHAPATTCVAHLPENKQNHALRAKVRLGVMRVLVPDCAAFCGYLLAAQFPVGLPCDHRLKQFHVVSIYLQIYHLLSDPSSLLAAQFPVGFPYDHKLKQFHVVSIYLQIYYLLSDPSSRLPVVGNPYSSAQPNVAGRHDATARSNLLYIYMLLIAR